MALGATAVIEVRTTGNDNNGGAYDAAISGAVTDYSQQDAAQLTLTDLVAVQASTTLTSVTGGFTLAMIGNAIQIISGANFTAGWYFIIARTDTNTVTLDRAPATVGAGSGGTGSVGGALASPGNAAKLAIQAGGMDVHVKAGTYLITSTTANISGGRIDLSTPGASDANVGRWIGYGSIREDNGTAPLFQVSGAISTFTIIGVNSNPRAYLANITVDGASKTSIRGFSLAAQGVKGYRLTAKNCTNRGFDTSSATGILEQCAATNCSLHGFNTSGRVQLIECTAYNNATGALGFVLNNGATAWRCLAWGNNGDGFYCSTTSPYAVYQCVAYNNGGSGFNADTTSLEFGQIQECIAVSNAGYGFKANSSIQDNLWLVNCAAYNNTSGAYNSNIIRVPGFITLTADPFVDASTQDFRLNTTTGGGAACRGAGSAPYWPGASTNMLGYPDLGPAQHQDAGSGGTKRRAWG